MMLAIFAVACLFVSAVGSGIDTREASPNQLLSLDMTSRAIKDLSNYTLTWNMDGFKELIEHDSVVEIDFSSHFAVWLKPQVALKDINGNSQIFFADVIGNRLVFKLKQLSYGISERVGVILYDVVNPNDIVMGPEIQLSVRDILTVYNQYNTEKLKFSNKLGKINVVNKHTQFTPGFYTSPYLLRLDSFFAYSTKVRVISESPFLTPEPAEIVIDWNRLTLIDGKVKPIDQLQHYFRVAISRDTAPGIYYIRFQVEEDNDRHNYLLIERLELEVAFPDNQYSVHAPRPFNGPRPEIRFNQRVYQAPLGGFSALKYLTLTPPPTDPIPLEIKTMLPTQSDKIDLYPGSLIMKPKSGWAYFYLKAKVGAVSGNLHLHIPDTYYKNLVVMKEKKTYFDVVYNEVERDHIRVISDDKVVGGIGLTDTSYKYVRAAIKRGRVHKLRVENTLQMVMDHQGMVMFLFVKNMSDLSTGHLYKKKLIDLDPFQNNTLLDLGNNMAVYFGFPTYCQDLRGYSMTIDTTLRDFLPYLDHKIFMLFRDGLGNLHMVDSYVSKHVSSNLKLYKLAISAPAWMAKSSVYRYLLSFTDMKHRLVQSSKDGLAVTEDVGRPIYEFLHIAKTDIDHLQMQLEDSILNVDNMPLFKYYLYLENNTILKSEDWLKLEKLSELSLESTSLDIEIEDLSEQMIKYSLDLNLNDLADFQGMLDFATLLKLSKKTTQSVLRSKRKKNRDELEERSGLLLLDKQSLNSSKTYAGLETGEEYALEARTCIFFENNALCDTRTVAYIDEETIPGSSHTVDYVYHEQRETDRLYVRHPNTLHSAQHVYLISQIKRFMCK